MTTSFPFHKTRCRFVRSLGTVGFGVCFATMLSLSIWLLLRVFQGANLVNLAEFTVTIWIPSFLCLAFLFKDIERDANRELERLRFQQSLLDFVRLNQKGKDSGN